MYLFFITFSAITGKINIPCNGKREWQVLFSKAIWGFIRPQISPPPLKALDRTQIIIDPILIQISKGLFTTTKTDVMKCSIACVQLNHRDDQSHSSP